VEHEPVEHRLLDREVEVALGGVLERERGVGEPLREPAEAGLGDLVQEHVERAVPAVEHARGLAEERPEPPGGEILLGELPAHDRVQHLVGGVHRRTSA
jgi:hypothetical protein